MTFMTLNSPTDYYYAKLCTTHWSPYHG